MSSIVIARAFCIAAHAAVGQVRKYTGEPYSMHPMEVARIIVEHVPDYTDEMICAALLHDVVEDTQVPLEVVRAMFGPTVADMVEQLTDVSKPEDGNRAVRKAVDKRHTAQACPAAKTVKLADLISNSSSITAHDPEFAKVYLAEKRALLEVLREGDPTLYQMAYEIAHGAAQ